MVQPYRYVVVVLITYMFVSCVCGRGDLSADDSQDSGNKAPVRPRALYLGFTVLAAKQTHLSNLPMRRETVAYLAMQ